MAEGLVTIFGGSGFIGRYAARALVEQGWRVRVACRRVNTAADVKLAGTPGWVDVVQANIRNRASIERAIEGADAVINLVGILNQTHNQDFEAIRDGAALLADVAAEQGIEKFVQVSAITATKDSSSTYCVTKAEADEAVLETIPSATILRPAIVFGPEDGFFNRIASSAGMPFVMPVIGGDTKIQPIYAGDVAAAIAATIVRDDTGGKTYELGGPRTYTTRELFKYTLSEVDKRRFLIGMPSIFAKPLGYIFGTIWAYIPPFRWNWLGDPPFTGDQVKTLAHDCTVSEGALTIADLGVDTLESVEAIAPTYLWRFRDYGEFHKPASAVDQLD